MMTTDMFVYYGALFVIVSYAGAQETNTVALGGTAEFYIPDLNDPIGIEYLLLHPDQRVLAKVSSFHKKAFYNCTFTEPVTGPLIINCPINSEADYGMYRFEGNNLSFSYKNITQPGPTTIITSASPTTTAIITATTTTTQSCGLSKSDAVIILDSSTSVTESNFQKMREFVKGLISNTNVDSGCVRYGLGIYSTDVQVLWQLNEFSTASDLSYIVDQIPYIYGSTNTADALETMHYQMFTTANGDRPDAPNVCILLTDGVSNINYRRTIPEAQEARKAGILIYVIGIGLQDTREVEGIASRPISSYLINIQSFEELKGLEKYNFTATFSGEECPQLPRPSHSQLAIDQYRTPGAEARYTCNDGYIIAGTISERNRTRLCQNNGTWSGTAPTCLKSEISESIVSSKVTAITTQHTPLNTVTAISTEKNQLGDVEATTVQQTPTIKTRLTLFINATTEDTSTSNNTLNSPESNITGITIQNTTLSNFTSITINQTPIYSNETRNKTVGSQEATSSTAPTYISTQSQLHTDLDVIKDEIETGTITVTEALVELNRSTSNTNISQSELGVVENLLDQIVDKSELESDNVNNISKTFVGVTCNLISDRTQSAWMEEIKTGREGAEKVIKLVDKMMSKVLGVYSDKDMFLNVTTPEIYIETVSIKRCDRNITFPEMKGPNYIESECPKDQSKTSFSGMLYEDIGQIVALMPANYKGKVLQPTIIGFEQPGFQGKVLINIQAQKGFRDPVCVFLDFSLNQLSTEGCRLLSFEFDTVRCECNHLTNFAVLMSPMEIDVRTTTTLNIVSMVGCIISIICLLITIAVHVLFRRQISTNQDKISLLMTLCGVLVVTYLLFLTGIDKTENKVICTAVAVSLHYLLLVAFLLMLAEGIYHVKLVFRPRAVQPSTKALVIATLIISTLFVGITAVSSQLDGYGTDKACWLSTTTGIKWTFIIPAGLVVLANVILTAVILWKINHLKGMDSKKYSEKIKKAVRDVLFLSSIFGFTWIFGLFSFNEDTVVFQYIFAVLNSLQGFFIMLVHCILNKKVRSVVQTRSQRRKKHVELSEQASKPTTSTLNRTVMKTELQTVMTSEVNKSQLERL